MSLPNLDIIALNPGLDGNDPQIELLTTTSIDGTGVFDQLMRTVKLHLSEEYNAGRITGKEYSTVYIGALTAVLQQAVAYIEQFQNTAKINAEVGLIHQQIVTELANTSDYILSGLGFGNAGAVGGLVGSKKAIDLLQANLVEAQVEKSNKEVVLIGQQIITELAQTSSTEAIPSGYGLNSGTTIDGLAKAQRLKLDAETDLTKQKVVTEVAQVSDTLPSLSYAKHATLSVAGIAVEAKNKTNAEAKLLKQKIVTELAQTYDHIPSGYSIDTGQTTVNGVIEKQKLLFAQQTDGFKRDAEQKLAKLMVDSWSVQKTVDSNTLVTGTNLDAGSIGAVIAKAKLGIGV